MAVRKREKRRVQVISGKHHILVDGVVQRFVAGDTFLAESDFEIPDEFSDRLKWYDGVSETFEEEESGETENEGGTETETEGEGEGEGSGENESEEN